MSDAAIEVNEEIYCHFHKQWDNFPSPVMLLRKDRTILAINKTGLDLRITAGMHCTELSTKKACQRCQANQALAEKSGKRAVGYNGQYKVFFDTYWIPLAGEEDLYLHFSINISEYAKESLFPPK
jgi:hypothetical protein